MRETVELAEDMRAAAPSQRASFIAILAHAGNRNLGDEAIIASLIQNTRDRYPNAEVICFTNNPADTRQTHGVTAYAIHRPEVSKTGGEPNATGAVLNRIKSWSKSKRLLYRFCKVVQRLMQLSRAPFAELVFLADCYRKLRRVELVLVAGSQQLSDHYGGPWGFPYTLLKWTALARLRGARVAFMSMGAGPLTSKRSQRFARRALSMASYHSYRTENSRDLVEQIGLTHNNLVVPDLVFSFRVRQLNRTKERDGTVVGVNPIPFFDRRYWHEADGDVYAQYVAKMASFCCWLTENRYRVSLFPTQLRADPLVIADISSAIKQMAGEKIAANVVEQTITSLDDLISAISIMDLVVAARFHGVIIPCLLGKPVLAMAYHRKTRELMEQQMHQSDFVLDIDSFDVRSLQERFTWLACRRQAIAKELAMRVRECREVVEKQYESVFRLLHA